VRYPQSVTVTDVSLRDGLQIEPRLIPTATKLTLLTRLLDAGVRELEVGSFVNPRLVPTMADTAEVCRRLPVGSEARFVVLVLHLKGARLAVSAGANDVRVVLSASEGHSKSNSNRTVSEGVAEAARIRELLTSTGVRVAASVATSFVCPFDGLVPLEQLTTVVSRLVETGFSEVSLADTIGMANPDQVERTVHSIRERFPATTFGLHLHNTYGMGLANVVAGLRQGIRQFDSALGGIGGCPFAPGAAGNIATEDLVFMLHGMGVHTGIDLEALSPGVRDLRVALGRPLESSVSRARGWLGKSG